MRILILGSSGFIGNALLDYYRPRAKKVYAYDLGWKSSLPDVDYIQGDFTQENRWKNILKDVDVCFHLVSTKVPKTSNDDPLSDIQQNLSGTVNLLNFAKEHGVKIIFSSSGGTVYGNTIGSAICENHSTHPLCSYGIVKLAIEKYLYMYREIHGLNYVVLRLANPYGPGQNLNNIQGAPAVFLGRALANVDVDIWGDGEQVRDFIYIDDVVDAFSKAARHEGLTRVFNIGSGEGISLNKLLGVIESVVGHSIKNNKHLSRSVDVSSNILCIKSAMEELKWSPAIGLDEGMSRMAEWALSTYNFSKGYPPEIR